MLREERIHTFREVHRWALPVQSVLPQKSKDFRSFTRHLLSGKTTSLKEIPKTFFTCNTTRRGWEAGCVSGAVRSGNRRRRRRTLLFKCHWHDGMRDAFTCKEPGNPSALSNAGQELRSKRCYNGGFPWPVHADRLKNTNKTRENTEVIRTYRGKKNIYTGKTNIPRKVKQKNIEKKQRKTPRKQKQVNKIGVKMRSWQRWKEYSKH